MDSHDADTDTPGARRLTADEREQIVRLRLDNVPYRQIADQLGSSTRTVARWWQRHLDEQGQERRQRMEAWQAELAARQMHIARTARQAYQALTSGTEPDWATARGYLAEERQALREAARVTGLDVITLHATVETPLQTATEATAREAIGKLPVSTLERVGLARAQ